MNVATIDEVIAALETIVADSRKRGSRAGYFAVLYRRMTVAVKNAIAEGEFQDGERFEKLDVAFAKRYLDAYEAYNAKQPLTESWQVAFDACNDPEPCVLQHLYAGLAAHQLLDLGIAAAEVAPGSEIGELHRDFAHVNRIVKELMSEIDSLVGSVSPWIGALNKALGVQYAAANNAGIYVARGIAWHTAVDLASLGPEERARKIEKLDRRTAIVARGIVKPKSVPRWIAKLVRLKESNDVSRNIELLDKKKD